MGEYFPAQQGSAFWNQLPEAVEELKSISCFAEAQTSLRGRGRDVSSTQPLWMAGTRKGNGV